MKRENGFYWVRYNNIWTIAEWANGDWYLPGIETMFEDNDFTNIIEIKLIQESK